MFNLYTYICNICLGKKYIFTIHYIVLIKIIKFHASLFHVSRIGIITVGENTGDYYTLMKLNYISQCKILNRGGVYEKVVF